MEIRKVIARNLTALRGEMSRKELAKLAGVTYQTIYDIEEENKNPSIDAISKIASALDVSPSDIFKEEGPDRTPATINFAIEVLQKMNSLSDRNRNLILKQIDQMILAEEINNKKVAKKA